MQPNSLIKLFHLSLKTKTMNNSQSIDSETFLIGKSFLSIKRLNIDKLHIWVWFIDLLIIYYLLFIYSNIQIIITYLFLN